jgi:2-polyprenyl-6-hydroxyphenyl methylase/3-demethylubiquinone-9 3-methyltransferase
MSFQQKIEEGKRFEFGNNWQSFLSVLDEERIKDAQKSFCDFLGEKDLTGKSFLDIGSGSGLSSLVARRLGAKVHSFDYDANSVACTKELKRHYFNDDSLWQIEKGSVLDRKYIEGLGQFDICHAYGVLHHTGNLWQALYNAQLAVSEGGLLFVAIYNDQGIISSCWRLVKKAYCSGKLFKAILTVIFYFFFFCGGLFIDIGHFANPLKRYKDHKRMRGMSLIHDWKDWLGGYPFETVSPSKFISFFENIGYKLNNFKSAHIGFGNNQYLFEKVRVK